MMTRTSGEMSEIARGFESAHGNNHHKSMPSLTVVYAQLLSIYMPVFDSTPEL